MRLFFTGTFWLMLALASCQQRAQPTTNPAAAATPEPTPAQHAGSTVAAGEHDRGRVGYYTYEVVNTYPHDASAFTQGLEFHDGFLYESTGRNGASSLRKVELATGKVLQRRDLDAQYFGEGVTVLGNRVYQLTWQANKGFVYDLQTFKPTKEFPYRGEGWGLTDNGQFLMMSDGSNQIRLLDPKNFAVKKTLDVLDRGMPLSELNELEFVRGVIYANVWQTDQVVQIDPDTGKIIGWLDLAGLLPRADTPTDTEGVLNGIAYDAASDRLFVTGKLWPKLFEIRLKKK